MATIAKPFFSVSTITRELRATCRSDRDQQCFNGDSDSENPLAWSVGCVCVWFHALTIPFTHFKLKVKIACKPAWKVWKHIETNQIWNNQSKWLKHGNGSWRFVASGLDSRRSMVWSSSVTNSWNIKRFSWTSSMRRFPSLGHFGWGGEYGGILWIVASFFWYLVRG